MLQKNTSDPKPKLGSRKVIWKSRWDTSASGCGGVVPHWLGDPGAVSLDILQGDP